MREEVEEEEEEEEGSSSAGTVRTLEATHSRRSEWEERFFFTHSFMPPASMPSRLEPTTVHKNCLAPSGSISLIHIAFAPSSSTGLLICSNLSFPLSRRLWPSGSLLTLPFPLPPLSWSLLCLPWSAPCILAPRRRHLLALSACLE